MSFVINGQVIKTKDSYLAKGERSRINSSMEKQLYTDFQDLMKYINRPMSIGFDNLILLLQEDEELLKHFIDKCKKY